MIKICVWTCDMTSRSYFGKMFSTLGSVVPLAMFCYKTLTVFLQAGATTFHVQPRWDGFLKEYWVNALVFRFWYIVNWRMFSRLNFKVIFLLKKVINNRWKTPGLLTGGGLQLVPRRLFPSTDRSQQGFNLSINSFHPVEIILARGHFLIGCPHFD